MKIVKMALKSIREAEYNPRRKLQPEDREYQALRRSIEEFGQVEPLIVNKRTGNLVGGHQRLQVLKDLGEKQVDVVEVDLDPKKEKALNVALNKITGRWDRYKLKALLIELDDGAFDIDMTGFGRDDLKDMMEMPLRDIPADLRTAVKQKGLKECPTCHRSFRGRKKPGEKIILKGEKP